MKSNEGVSNGKNSATEMTQLDEQENHAHDQLPSALAKTAANNERKKRRYYSLDRTLCFGLETVVLHLEPTLVHQVPFSARPCHRR